MASAEHKRLACLDAMGIQVWTARLSQPLALAAPRADEQTPEDLSESESAAVAAPATQGWEAATPERAMAQPVEEDVPPAPEWLMDDDVPWPSEDNSWILAPEPAAPEPADWDSLERRVAACGACPLHRSRTQTVFGVGNRDADWMVIGEAPGEQEDLRGEPFVGPAGMLLNEMLRAIGLSREQVYIANILKCRPPGNRDPQPEEVAACESHLKLQVALVRPRIILAVGRIAAQNLLKTTTAIGKLRGQVHRYEQIPLVVTYHPAYLLRTPLEKRRAWDDLRLALNTYRHSVTEEHL